MEDYSLIKKLYLTYGIRLNIRGIEQRYGEVSEDQGHEYLRKISSETHQYGTLERGYWFTIYKAEHRTPEILHMLTENLKCLPYLSFSYPES